MAGEEMAALASLQKQVADLKSAIYYLTEKLGATAGAGGEAAGGDVVAALEALSKEVKALEDQNKTFGDQCKALADQVGYVSRISSDGFSSIKGATDKVGAAATPQQVDAMGATLASKIDYIAKSIPPAQDISGLSKKVDSLSENLGFVARQSSETVKKLDDTGARLATSSTDTEAKLNTLLQRLDQMAGEAQAKEMSLLSEALSLMSKELASAKASYSDLQRRFEAMPTAPQMERLATAMTRLNEAQTAQDKKMATILEGLAIATKQLGEDKSARAVAPMAEQLNRIAGQLAKVSEAAENQRRQNEIMASALSTLVKQVSNVEKGMPSYADIEKRVMGKLAEKMAGQ